MSEEGDMKHLLAALVVVSASMVAGIGVVSASTPADTKSPHRNTVILGLLDGLQNFIDGFLDAVQGIIERIDKFLEAVVDLLKTLQELFGGGEGD
jgi:phage-related protein